MKKRKFVKNIIFALLVLCIATSCATPYKYKMMASKGQDEKIQVIKIRDKDHYISTRNNVELVVCANSSFNDEIFFSVGVVNNSYNTITVLDSQFKVYRSRTGETWEEMGTWNAEAFYEAAEKEYRTRRTLAFISAVSSALLNGALHASSDSRYYPASNVIGNSIQLTGLVVADELLDTPKSSKLYLEVLQNSMFYSTQVRKGTEYDGTIIFKADKYTDFRLEFTDSDGYVRTFEFQREDKPYVLNHWLDNPFMSRAAHTWGYDFGSLQSEVAKVCVSSRWFGFTPDISLYIGATLGQTGKNYVKFMCDIGATYKVAPYTWLVGGAQIGIHDSSTVNGSSSGKIYFAIAPELGVAFNINHLTIDLILSYGIVPSKLDAGSFGAELGLGFNY